MTLYISQDDKLSSCGHVNVSNKHYGQLWDRTFQAFWFAQAIIMISNCVALQLPSWSKLMIFNFSHNRTPNLMFFSEISFWNETFLCSIKTEMFTVAESLYWFSLCIKTLGIASCTMPSARDFVTVLRDTFWPYILQMQWNELKYGFYCQNPACFPWIYLSIVHK